MQKKLFHLYLKVNLYSKLYTMTQKTKILTLSLVSVAGLAAFTVFASNNTSQLEFKGEVKQNINLELKQLNLMPDITQKNNGGAAGISWKIVWDTLTTVDPATNAPNTVTKQGKFSFGGHGNITNAAESLILAGEENNLSANTSIVGASKKIVGNQGEGNTVLSSSDITFAGDNHIINSSAHTQVNGTGNIVFSSEDVAINTIGSMAVGKKIRINHPGSFIFNGTDTEVASNKEYTTKIMADKGMIINTNSQKAGGVDLTINGGLKVAHNTTDGVWAIISQEKCLKIKEVNKGEIWFWCSTTPETQISTPKCGKNATDYPATASAWKESSNKGFCENGTLSPSTHPTFWTDAEKAAAKSNGSYASAGFGKYSFTICFVEGDPFCKASGAKKTWRCTTQEGNAMTCEATIAAEAKKCKANEHLEGTTCVANTKQVACDNTNINSANGTVSNNQVTITRSNGSWSVPEKCKLNCNAGYEKKTDPITHRESCEKTETCLKGQYKDWNSCKDKTLKITISSEWQKFPNEMCPISEDNFISIIAWSQEKRLSVCSAGSFIFTGDIKEYSFQWKTEETDSILTRSIKYGRTHQENQALDFYENIPVWLYLMGEQTLTPPFTNEEIFIKNTNIPKLPPLPPIAATNERFNEVNTKNNRLVQDRESLTDIKRKYNLTEDIFEVQCRFTDNNSYGFESSSNSSSLQDTPRSLEIKQRLFRDWVNIPQNILSRTIILDTQLNHATEQYGWNRSRQAHRTPKIEEHGISSDNLYLWYVQITREEVILHRRPISCNTKNGYIGPDFEDDKFYLSSRSDMSIRLINTKWKIIKH